MICPNCGYPKSSVSATDPTDHVVWRRRTCKRCGHTWETSEMQDEKPGPGRGRPRKEPVNT